MKRKPYNIEARRHVADIALDLFLDANQPDQIASTLGTNNPNYYLTNRISKAFMEGWDAAQRHYGHIHERHGKP